MSFFEKLFKQNQNSVSTNTESISEGATEKEQPEIMGQQTCRVGDHPADAHSNDLFEQAKDYHLGRGVQKDVQKAASLYREAMNQGDKRAKHNLAIMYIEQEGADVATGIQMLQESADEGDSFSITALADCYMKGNGVKKDVAKGIELLQSASDKGVGEASYLIGAYYINECHDLEKGLKYCEKASEQGSVLAASILAEIYEEGMGVEKDLEKSFSFRKRAAELGDPTCQLKHGMMLYYAKKDKEGLDWMMRSAQQNYLPALFLVGREYLKKDCHLFTNPKHFDIGIGMLRDAASQGVEDASKILAYYGLEKEQNSDERAAIFYNILENADGDTGQQAFQQMMECCSIGDPIAQIIIGGGYYYGTFVEQDKEHGLQMIKDACDRGYPDALNAMGMILNNEGRYDEALPYHKRSAEQGDKFGLHNLGNAYFYARGVERDEQKAIALWKKAAEMGNPDSYCTLGNMYFRGAYVEQNIPEAIRCYSIPANQPCSSQMTAMRMLVDAYRLLGDDNKAMEWENKLKNLQY